MKHIVVDLEMNNIRQKSEARRICTMETIRKFDTQNPQKPVMALFFAQILILCIAYMRI